MDRLPSCSRVRLLLQQPVLRIAPCGVVKDVSDRRYAHTSHLHVRVAGRVLVDEHFTGPVVGDVFSISKSVMATAVGIAARQGWLAQLDAPVADVLVELRGTPAEGHTWRHVLTMTRGSQVDGPWDVDELTARSGPLIGPNR